MIVVVWFYASHTSFQKRETTENKTIHVSPFYQNSSATYWYIFVYFLKRRV